MNKSTKDKPYFLPQAGSNIRLQHTTLNYLSVAYSIIAFETCQMGIVESRRKIALIVYSVLCHKSKRNASEEAKNTN